MTRYLYEDIRPLVLILPKMSGYVKTFKVKDGYKDKNNKLMSCDKTMISYQKNIKPFGLSLKVCEILNWMLY